MRRLRFFIFVISRSLTFRGRRTLPMVGALAMVVLLVTLLVQFAFGVKRELAAGLDLYGANLVATPRGAGLTAGFGEYSFGTVDVQSDFNEDVFAAALTHLGLGDARCLTLLRGTGYIGDSAVPLVGIDLAELQRRDAGKRYSGQWPAADTDVLIGRRAAAQNGVTANTSVLITINNRAVPLQVTGILETGSRDDDAILLQKTVLQQLLAAPGRISEAAISAQESASQLGELAAAIEARCPEVKVQVIRKAVFAAAMLVTKISLLLLLITVIVALATCVSIMSTQGVTVLERRSEFGLLKALGVPRAAVCRVLLAEALVAGLVAGLAGTPAGLLLSKLFSNQIFAVDLPIYLPVIWAAPLAGCAAAVVGNIVPIRNVLRWQPADMLR